MLLDVVSVKVRPDFQLDLEFENGEQRRFDAPSFVDTETLGADCCAYSHQIVQ